MEFVHEQVLRVLGEVGVAYNSSQAIDLLAEAGAQVDRERLTARLDWRLIARCLKTVPRTVPLAGRVPDRDVLLGGERLVVTSDGMATYMYDDTTGTRREGTARDLADAMRLCDALPEIDTLWPSPNAADLDPVTAPLEMNAITLRSSTKHVQDEVRVPGMVEPMLAIFEAVAGARLGQRPLFSVTSCTIAPLQHDAEMTDAGLKLCRRGVPIFVLPMPQAGTTGPVTVLGTSIVNLAELLSAVVLFQLASPGCALISGVGAATADLRNGQYVSGGPEIGLINLVCLQMSKFYGLPTQATGVSTDAKACDLQAGAEGMMSGLAAALAGADSLIAAGTLDAVQSHSLAKTVLDADTVGMIRRFCRPEPIDAAKALMDDIVEVGIGGHYLGRRSTRTLARAGELWRPSLFRRGAWEESAGRSLAADAAQRARELLASHEVPPLADDVEAEIAGVIASYRKAALA
jgi:trimethylamine--corrinoid protein Co-methyltransferase